MGGKTIRVTASLGISMMPYDGTRAERLVKVSDQNLYASKHSGRNRVTCSEGVLEKARAEQAVLLAQQQAAAEEH